MSEFPEYLSFKFGIYVADIVNWLIDNFESFFNAVRDLILWFLLKEIGRAHV